MSSRKKTKQELLLESEERFRVMFEGHGAAMLLIEPDSGQITDANEAAARFYGYSREQLRAMCIDQINQLRPEEVAAERRNAVDRIRNVFVFPHRLAGGDVRFVEVYSSPVTIQGRPILFSIIHDITERKRAEQRERREHNETAFANRILRLFVEHDGDELFDRVLAVVQEGMASKHGVFGYIAETGHLMCPSLSKMLDECEIEGKCIHYPPEKWKGLWARALREKRSFHTNVAPRVPPGHPIIHNNLAAPILFQGQAIGLLNLANKEGGYTEEDRERLDAVAARMAPVLYVWIQRKLHDEARKQREEALRDSTKRLKTIFQMSPVGIFFSRSGDAKFIDVNEAFLEIIGYEREQVIGRTPSELGLWVAPQDRKRFGRSLAGQGRIDGIELRHRRKNGDIIDVQIILLPLDLEGEPCFIGTLVDVTERKRAEEALRESAEKYRGLYESLKDAVLRVNMEGTILDTNAACREMLGYAAEELSRLTYMDLTPPKWHAMEAAIVDQQIVARGYSDAFEKEYVRKDGTVFPISIRVWLIKDPEGRPVGMWSIVRDITERKAADEQLKKAYDELEKRVQERTSELSVAVERLRVENIQRRQLENTLRESENRVRFFASQCLTAQETERKRIAGELHDSIAASLSAIRFSIESTAEAIKQGRAGAETLLDLGSKVAEVTGEVRRIMADLRPSILDDLGIIPAVNWFCREYQKTYSHIRLGKQAEIAEEEVPEALKTPIFRIVQEAMNNIAKHSKASFLNLSLRKEEGKILLTIQDDGRGFDLATVRKGMGLSTMVERAELSGGVFTLDTAAGRGTTLRVAWRP